MQSTASPIPPHSPPHPGPERPARAAWRGALRLLARQRRGDAGAPETERGAARLDSFLFLLVVCAMLLPTTAGYELASAAAQSIVGLPFAALMFLSPFAVMALLPLRLLHLTLDGLFGIRLRLGLLAPLALVCLAMVLALGPRGLRPLPAGLPVTDETAVVADLS